MKKTKLIKKFVQLSIYLYRYLYLISNICIYIHIYMYIYIYIYIYILSGQRPRITNHRTAGEGGGHFSLPTPHYHFHPPHRHLDISRTITAESSPLHITSSRTQTRETLVSERKSLTIKLHERFSSPQNHFNLM